MTEGSLSGSLWLAAIGMMFIVEGLLPFLNPQGWRRLFEQVLQLSDGQIRFIGLGALLLGLVLLGFGWR